jgi:hypothetical protein
MPPLINHFPLSSDREIKPETFMFLVNGLPIKISRLSLYSLIRYLDI